MSVLPDPGASRAVLVGTSHYQHLEQLPAVSNNLQTLAGLMSGPLSLQLPAQHVTVLEDPASADRVVSAVRQAAAEATDTLIVYFAGHGLIDPQGTLSLALSHTEFGRIETGLPYEWLRQVLLLDSNAERHVVILDCCYSGLALGRMSASPGLADQAAVEGTFLLAAAAETRTALAPVGDTYTAFTGTLVETLTHGIPGGPELLDLGTIYRHLHRTLTARGHPVPQARDRNGGAQVALGRNHAALPAPPAPAPPGTEAARRPQTDPASIRTAADSVPTPRTQPEKQDPFLKTDDDHLAEDAEDPEDAEDTDAESPPDTTPTSMDTAYDKGTKSIGVRVHSPGRPLRATADAVSGDEDSDAPKRPNPSQPVATRQRATAVVPPSRRTAPRARTRLAAAVLVALLGGGIVWGIKSLVDDGQQKPGGGSPSGQQKPGSSDSPSGRHTADDKPDAAPTDVPRDPVVDIGDEEINTPEIMKLPPCDDESSGTFSASMRLAARQLGGEANLEVTLKLTDGEACRFNFNRGYNQLQVYRADEDTDSRLWAKDGRWLSWACNAGGSDGDLDFPDRWARIDTSHSLKMTYDWDFRMSTEECVTPAPKFKKPGRYHYDLNLPGISNTDTEGYFNVTE